MPVSLEEVRRMRRNPYALIITFELNRLNRKNLVLVSISNESKIFINPSPSYVIVTVFPL